jgi:hypothetical protein
MSHRLDEMDGGGFVMVVGRLKSWNCPGEKAGLSVSQVVESLIQCFRACLSVRRACLADSYYDRKDSVTSNGWA